jgi:hypothetical protein
LYVQIKHKSKYYPDLLLFAMVQNRNNGKKLKKEKIKTKEENSDIQEFYLMEKLYQTMRDDKLRGKRPSAKEFYLMEKLYQVMVIDKNRNLNS